VNTHWTERLSEYLDGELPATERTECEAHLSDCQICRTVLNELQEVTAFARADADRLPTTNLWPGIVSQIATANVSEVATAEAAAFMKGGASALPFRTARRQYTFSLAQLALAASLLIAVSGGVAYLAAGRIVFQQTVAQEAPIQAQAEPQMAPAANVERANFADAQYDEAVADLEKILVNMRDELDPRTIMVIEKNLTVIDEAIQQARDALDADPANTFLNSHLADSRRRKLDLLRRATMIPSASGD
jgi:negative regulator of sigma E activity